MTRQDRWDWGALLAAIALCALALLLTGCFESRTETASQTKKTSHRVTLTKDQVPVPTAAGIQVVPVTKIVEVTEDEDADGREVEAYKATVPIPPAVGAVANAIAPGAGALIAAASSTPAGSDGMGSLIQAGLAVTAAIGGTAAAVKHRQAAKAQADADEAWADVHHYAHHAPPGTPPPPSMG